MGNQAIGEDRTTNTTTTTTGTRTMTWDWENRLRKVKDDQMEVTYDYDADGERRLKTLGTVETIYADRLYEVENGSARQLATVNVYLGDTRLVSKVVPLNSPSVGYEQQNTYYYHADHIGNSTLVTDYLGREYERFAFTPHGEIWQQSSLDTLDKVEYLFTGKQMDPETGWYNFGARYLNPKTGLWLSSDPALGEYIPKAPLTDEDKEANKKLPGMGGIYNPINFALYHFAGNNPVKYTDPDGKADFLTGLQKGFAYASQVQFGTPEAALEIMGSVEGAEEWIGFVLGSVATGTVYERSMDGGSARLRPYREGGGHHIPAKSALRGDPAYNPRQALAIPKEELARLKIDHDVVTGSQKSRYQKFEKTGQELTWDAVKVIETAALIDGGATPAVAKATVDKAVQAVIDSGVEKPTRIPWGEN